MNIKHILVDMDPTSDKQPALSRAIDLAKKFNASIELFLVVYNNSLMLQWFLEEEQLERMKQSYLQSKQRWLDTFVSEVVDARIPVSIDVRWHKPIYEGIIQKVKDSNADLVIKSTHRHPKINKLFFSPNDWQLLKTCPVPLLLAKQDIPDGYNHVMAAIDPTQTFGKAEGLDKVILDTTTDLADILSATGHVCHCHEPVERQLWPSVGANDPGLGLSFNDIDNLTNDLQNNLKKSFDDITENYPFDEENKHLVSGDAIDELPNIVDANKINLLVMGTTYHTGLLGSTVEKILDNVHCDIWAVKTEDFELINT